MKGVTMNAIRKTAARALPAALLLALAAQCHGALAAPSAKDLEAAKTLAANHCAVCHTFEKGAPPGQGPNLYAIFGAKAGAADGYAYSEGFRKAMADRTWDRKLLDQWLTDTQAVAPGSGMTYFQDDPNKRAKLILFLESLR
jgi:cytochrome c